MPDLRLEYVWTCAACKREHVLPMRVGKGEEIFVPPILPFEWKALDGRTVCNAHKVAILIDGELLK